MSEAITIARPYAQAAFDEAQKLNALREWSEMLLSLAQAVNHPEVQAAVSNPRVPAVQIAALMDDLLGTSASAQQRNFVRIVADNRRLLCYRKSPNCLRRARLKRKNQSTWWWIRHSS